MIFDRSARKRFREPLPRTNVPMSPRHRRDRPRGLVLVLSCLGVAWLATDTQLVDDRAVTLDIDLG